MGKPAPRFQYAPLRTFEAHANPKAPAGTPYDGPCVTLGSREGGELRSLKVLRRCEAEDLRDQLNAALAALDAGAAFDAEREGRPTAYRGPYPIRSHRTLAEVVDDVRPAMDGFTEFNLKRLESD